MTRLRVISGKARGRRLRSVPGDTTRPITDRAKESLFNILSPRIDGAYFLDLFAGTGSVGIEALSRGAAKVRFVDKNRRAVQTIHANLEITGLESGAEVLCTDSFRLLQKEPDQAFDFVYIAPPQYKGMWLEALIHLDKDVSWIENDAWVIAQIHPVEYQAIELHHLREFDRRKYGSTLFIFYSRESL